MKCSNPVQLKSGLVVPCGKCLLCLSARRDEWSVRLQLHSESFDSMPFFVTLTYEDKNLKYGDVEPTLCRSDLALFVKRLKERYCLHNTNFSYFGCGEYGDPQLSFRPHYHLLLFGFVDLQKVYEESWLKANKLIRNVWKLGNVDVGVAEWSGIHYVTKYVLKYLDDDYKGKQKPFIVYSNGIGADWLNTRAGRYLRSKFDPYKFRQALRDLPEIDTSDIYSLNLTAKAALRYLSPFVPSFRVPLPSGKYAAMPRFIRRKLVGSFEHFQDNPFWVYNSLEQLVESTEYFFRHRDYDVESDIPMSEQLIKFAEYKIKKRLLLKK